MSWQSHMRSQLGTQAAAEGAAPPRKCKFVYSSRTHSQLKNVIKELKLAVKRCDGAYDPIISVLGSREHMCVHPDVSVMKGAKLKARHGPNPSATLLCLCVREARRAPARTL